MLPAEIAMELAAERLADLADVAAGAAEAAGDAAARAADEARVALHAARRARAVSAWSMRCEGMSYREIGRALGCSGVWAAELCAKGRRILEDESRPRVTARIRYRLDDEGRLWPDDEEAGG